MRMRHSLKKNFDKLIEFAKINKNYIIKDDKK